MTVDTACARTTSLSLSPDFHRKDAKAADSFRAIQAATLSDRRWPYSDISCDDHRPGRPSPQIRSASSPSLLRGDDDG